MGYKGEFPTFNLTPAAAVSAVVPYQIDGSLSSSVPLEDLDAVLAIPFILPVV